MFQYVLFDLDGTLTDPKEGITKCVQFALMQQGIHEPDLDKLEPFIGPPLTDSFMEFYGMTREQAEIGVADYRKRFGPVGIFENKVYPGIPEMLAHLKEAGIKLAVASSKPEPFVKRILEHFGLEAYFDVVTGSNLDGSRIEKEAVVEEALRRLGQSRINQETCAMVGDRKFDIYGGRQFGLTTVGVSYGYAGKGELEAAGADHIVRTVKQLEQLLLDEKKNDRTLNAGEGSSSLAKAWNVLLPFILYYLGCNACYIVIAAILQLLSRPDGTLHDWLYQNSILLTGLAKGVSMLAGAGILFPLFQRERTRWQAKSGVSFLTMGILAGTMALGVNILFSLLHLTEASAEYEQVRQMQYQIPLLQGFVLYGLVSPLAEELLFRGLLYNRMKKYFSVMTAGLVSSVLFGVYHGNLVQGLYGAILGVTIVYAYEMTGNFKIPVFMHGIANCVVFAATYDPDIGAAIGTPVNCIIFLTISILSLFAIRKRKK